MDDNSLKTVRRNFEIIEFLQENSGSSVAEITDDLDIPSSTAHVHLKTLESLGYLVNKDGEYHIGLKFLMLGESARYKEEIYDLGSSEVEKLANETGELANLMIEENDRGVYIHRARGDQAIMADTRAGKSVDLHCRAAGKAILAYLPKERVKDIIDNQGLNEKSPHTITDEDDLFEELERIRENGYALDDGEQMEGLRCVGAPIISDDEVIGAISISGPKGRIRGSRFNKTIPEKVVSVANIIEINLSYS